MALRDPTHHARGRKFDEPPKDPMRSADERRFLPVERQKKKMYPPLKAGLKSWQDTKETEL